MNQATAQAEVPMYDNQGIAGHPKGLTPLFFTELWERFSYYGMRAFLILFMTASAANGGLGFDIPKAASIYGWYTSLVYATAIPGGWLADRYFGQRYAVLYGGILIALGHFSLAFHGLHFFYLGLLLIVLGTGLLKPNISAIVGDLYSQNDARRDAGFSLFYMGINIGAFVAPLVSGTLAQKVDWHWGFASAGVGMTIGLVCYIAGWKKLGNAGLKPKKTSAEKTDAPRISLTKEEKKRIAVIFILFIFSALFWSAFEQAGSSLNLFADQYVKYSIGNWTIPTTWFQSLNAFFIITLAMVLAGLWVRLGKNDFSSPAKFSLGLLFVGLGFLTVAIAAGVSGPEKNLVGPQWLIACYLFHTIGELCLSPVGLSMVTKLAPKRLVGSMMGVWFLSLALGNKLGGWIAGFFDSFPLPMLFGSVFLTTAIAALILAMLVKPIKRLMGGVN